MDATDHCPVGVGVNGSPARPAAQGARCGLKPRKTNLSRFSVSFFRPATFFFPEGNEFTERSEDEKELKRQAVNSTEKSRQSLKHLLDRFTGPWERD
jgi:hypothetical protein